MKMKYIRYFALSLTLLLSGCLSQAQEQLHECTAAAEARYPVRNATPPGQPFKDIYGCMWNAGYDLDNQLMECKTGDYTTIVSNAVCYRPKGVVGGYFYDLGVGFHTFR